MSGYRPSEPYLSSSRFPHLSEICSASSKGKRAKSNFDVKWEAAHHKCISCVYFLCLNTHNIKFTLFALNLQFCAFSTFIACNRHRHSRTFTHPNLKLCPYLSPTSPLPSPEAPVNPHPTFCLCEFASSRDLTEVGSPVFVLCDWIVSWSSMSSRLTQVRACVRIPCLFKAE